MTWVMIQSCSNQTFVGAIERVLNIQSTFILRLTRRIKIIKAKVSPKSLGRTVETVHSRMSFAESLGHFKYETVMYTDNNCSVSNENYIHRNES